MEVAGELYPVQAQSSLLAGSQRGGLAHSSGEATGTPRARGHTRGPRTRPKAPPTLPPPTPLPLTPYPLPPYPPPLLHPRHTMACAELSSRRCCVGSRGGHVLCAKRPWHRSLPSRAVPRLRNSPYKWPQLWKPRPQPLPTCAQWLLSWKPMEGDS